MTAPQYRTMLDAEPHGKQSLRLWLRLLGCSMLIEKRIRHRLAESFGTTLPRFDVLAALDRVPDDLTMSELSDMLLVSNGNVTAIIARLVDDGLVDRMPDEKDRRVLRVRLTDEGRSAFRAMAEAHETWIDEMMGDLGTAEIDSLLGGLSRVRTLVERTKR